MIEQFVVLDICSLFLIICFWYVCLQLIRNSVNYVKMFTTVVKTNHILKMPARFMNIENNNKSLRKQQIHSLKLAFIVKCNYFPPSNKMSWRHRNDVSLYVPATSQVCLKWNNQWQLDRKLPRCLSGTSPWRLIGTLWWRLKRT